MDTIKELGKNIGQGLASAVRGTVAVLIFFKNNMTAIVETVKILIAFKLVAFFYNLTTAIKGTTIAMALFNKITKKNILIGGAALLISQLDKIIKKIKEIRGITGDEKGDVGLPDTGTTVSKEIPESTFMQKLMLQVEIFRNILTSTNENELQTMKDGFFTIGETIAKNINEGIKKVSKSIAESIIMGKELSDIFKKISQELGIKILAYMIELTARLFVDYTLQKLKQSTLEKQTDEMRKQTKEQEKQNKAKGTAMLMSGNPMGFLGFMASGGAVGKGQPYMVGENGPELFVPNQSGQIQQNARGGSGGGSTTVNFNINTLDASGFEDLLVRSRGTITQLINSAVNERGSKNLI
jgi:hypothetical protein